MKKILFSSNIFLMYLVISVLFVSVSNNELLNDKQELPFSPASAIVCDPLEIVSIDNVCENVQQNCRNVCENVQQNCRNVCENVQQNCRNVCENVCGQFGSGSCIAWAPTYPCSCSCDWSGCDCDTCGGGCITWGPDVCVAWNQVCNQVCDTVQVCNQVCDTVQVCNQVCDTVQVCNQVCDTVNQCVDVDICRPLDTSSWDEIISGLEAGDITPTEVWDNISDKLQAAGYNLDDLGVSPESLTELITYCLETMTLCDPHLLAVLEFCSQAKSDDDSKIENLHECWNKINTSVEGWFNPLGYGRDYFHDTNHNIDLHTTCFFVPEIKWKETITTGFSRFFVDETDSVRHKYSECVLCATEFVGNSTNIQKERCPSGNTLMVATYENSGSTLGGDDTWKVNADGLASLPQVSTSADEIESDYIEFFSLANPLDSPGLSDEYKLYLMARMAYDLWSGYSFLSGGGNAAASIAQMIAAQQVDKWAYDRAETELTREVRELAEEKFSPKAQSINGFAIEFLDYPAGDTTTPSPSGDWIITSSTSLINDASIINGNLIIQNNSTLRIASGVNLSVDLINHNILIEPGSGILILDGGSINLN